MPNDTERDVNLIAAALRGRMEKANPRPFQGWLNAPLNVLDCVLSLNRRYESFCMPRVQRFSERRPEVQELASLRELILSFSSPLEFSVAELEYRDGRRAGILLDVTEYLLRAVNSVQESGSEMARLRIWAESVVPGDAWSTGIRGFGLAGFQYLRMLLGAQTAKPDIHINRFVSEIVGRKVSDWQSLALLEAAARKECMPLADLDYSIWLELSGASYEDHDS